jgi:FXSXX-COOH protein
MDDPEDVKTVIPDLSGIPVGELAEAGGTVLAEAIREYRERLREAGVPLFSSSARV